MEMVRVVDSLIEGLLSTGIVKEDIFIIKDEIEDIPKTIENVQDYLGWINLSKLAVSLSGGDKATMIVGVSGICTEGNRDYLQVVSKCLYAIKKAILYSAYTDDNEIENLEIVIDSQSREDSVIVVCYTSINVKFDVSYGA